MAKAKVKAKAVANNLVGYKDMVFIVLDVKIQLFYDFLYLTFCF